MLSAAQTLELCALCPIEPACERRQMREHFGITPPTACPGSETVKGQPYRCWLLSVAETDREKSG